VKKTLMTLALIGASGSAYAETVQDFNKTVINRVPYNVEVCTNQTMSGDKTGDTLKGAIIGGIIGNNVGDVKNGGALGAVLGGMIGHNNSNATGGTRRVCEVQTRYNEESVTIYSHSVVTFYHEGKQYKLRFQK
tara:strand:+ start:339 stop:740 length:402 start_codon:yes stop_codon:yes gene_type:complete